jgi:acetyltransferase-like isoleucine patch superfamily enzyme
VQLGARVTIHSDCWIHVVAAEVSGDVPKLILRDRVCIGMGATISAVRRIELGENVFTARNVYISDHGHEFRNADVPIADQGIGGVAEVSIGADTWIGQNAVILPGSRIGRHCVIGANAVVRGHVPDFSVAVGSPAKVVRRFNPSSNEWERVS